MTENAPTPPSGLPDEHEPLEPEPLGEPGDARPEGEGDPARGAPAQPGIPDEGEPPDAG